MTENDYELRVSFKMNDPTVLEARQLMDQLRSLITDLILHIFASKPRRDFLPFLIILFRMRETASSIELLVYANRERDASILMLNLMELRFDALYMAENISRIETWMKHDKENKKPWKVGNQITELFSDKNERDAEFSLYRRCSMTKHGNPLGGNDTFPIGIKDDWMVLSPECHPKKALHYILWCCSECTRVGFASIDIVREEVDVATLDKRLKQIEELRLSIFNKNIKAMVLQLNAENHTG